MNLIVIDDSFENRPDLQSSSPSGLQVMMFKKSIEEFPAVTAIGDIVQFRHFKVTYLFLYIVSLLIFLFLSQDSILRIITTGHFFELVFIYSFSSNWLN